MKVFNVIIAMFFLFSLASCKNESDTDTSTKEDNTEKIQSTYTAKMNAKSGSNVDGTVEFELQDNGAITYSVSLTGLDSNGVHAIHIHGTGDCSADDGTSAGGHWNPTGHDHGKLGMGDAFHLGDIGNLNANEGGSANLTGTTDKWSMKPGSDNSIIGKAVIVHAMADDFTSQPSGAAGTRIACGIIE